MNLSWSAFSSSKPSLDQPFHLEQPTHLDQPAHLDQPVPFGQLAEYPSRSARHQLVSQADCSPADSVREADEEAVNHLASALWELFRELGEDGVFSKSTAPTVCLLAPGERSGRRSTLSGGSQDDDATSTLRVAAEDLARPAPELLTVMLHGLVHVANARLGLVDCSATHYHNLKFRRLAERVGMWVPCSHARHGWAGTIVTNRLIDRFGALAEASVVSGPTSTDLPTGLPTGLPPAVTVKRWLCGRNLVGRAWNPRPIEMVELPPPPSVPRYRLALVRDNEGPYDQYPKIDRPARAAALLWRLLRHHDREALAVLYLDARRRLIGYDIPSIGTLSETAAEPRVVLTSALLLNAAGVVVGHNHISGDPRPSARDYAASTRLARAGDLLGVQLFDSLVVVEGGRWCTCLL